jgi:hypothetical protein
VEGLRSLGEANGGIHREEGERMSGRGADEGAKIRPVRAAADSGREPQVVRTDDLFLAAFALLRGGELVGVQVRGTNGRRVAVFGIGGAGVEDAEREFHRGPTLVDLRLLKSDFDARQKWTGSAREE